MRKIFFLLLLFLSSYITGCGQAKNVNDLELAKDKIKKYELAIWKSAVGDVFNGVDGVGSEKLNAINEIENIKKLFSKIQDSSFNEAIAQYFEGRKGILKEVDLFSQIEKKDNKITLEAKKNEIKSLEGINGEKIDSIYAQAEQDLVLNYAIGKRDGYIEHFIELISENDEIDIPKELIQKGDELEGVYAEMYKIALSSNVFKRNKNIANWSSCAFLINSWNEEYKKNEIKHLPFPILDDDCISIFKEYIKGDNSKEQEMCFKHLGEKERGQITELKDKYIKYKNKKETKEQFHSYFDKEFLVGVNEEMKSKFSKNDFFIPESWGDAILQNIKTYWYILVISFGLLLAIWKRFKRHSKKSNEVEVVKKDLEEVKIDLEKVKKDLEKEREKNLEEEEIQENSTQPEIDSNVEGILPYSKTKDIDNRTTESQSIPPLYVIRPYGNGFKDDDFFSDNEEKHYYIIRKTSASTATFEITANPDFQVGAAKSHVSILQEACEYNNMPFNVENGIKTLQKGELKIRDGFWEIEKKAIIQFI